MAVKVKLRSSSSVLAEAPTQIEVTLEYALGYVVDKRTAQPPPAPIHWCTLTTPYHTRHP